MRTQVVGLAIALVVGGACTDAHDECDPGAGISCTACKSITEPATLQIGGGDERSGFVDLQDGDEMEIFLGPNGLWRMSTSIRARGVYPGAPGRLGHRDDPLIVMEIFDGEELVGGPLTLHLGLTETDGGAEALAIWPFFTTDWDETIARFDGELVTLRGEITDACGNAATDELDVLAVYRDTSCLSCPGLVNVCRNGCDFEEQLTRVCGADEATRATSLSDCLCAACSVDCEMSCTGTGTDSDCGGCILAASSDACSAEYTECSSGGGGGCLSCSAFAAECRLGCDLDTVLSTVCEGEAQTLATTLSACVCAECASACELSCSGAGADIDCGTCVLATAVDATDPCYADYEACLGG